MPTREEMLKVDGHVFVRSRWVNCSKGDAANSYIRARLVACELNKGDNNDNFFASTPPLEAKNLLLPRYAKKRTRNDKPWRLSFVDVRKAYFNGIPKRDNYMSFPKKMGLPLNIIAKQVRGSQSPRLAHSETRRPTMELSQEGRSPPGESAH